MGKRMQPSPGQLCECSIHPLGQPSLDLMRVFYHKLGKYCYEWWCGDCCEREEISEREDGWPQGEDGRFMTAVHCLTIPGLD